ncbi:MAG TPA: hypothetical protein VF216_09845 [Mizugakiibacter sp.]
MSPTPSTQVPSLDEQAVEDAAQLILLVGDELSLDFQMFAALGVLEGLRMAHAIDDAQHQRARQRVLNLSESRRSTIRAIVARSHYADLAAASRAAARAAVLETRS